MAIFNSYVTNYQRVTIYYRIEYLSWRSQYSETDPWPTSRGANDVSYFPFDEIVEALVLALSLLAIEMAFWCCEMACEYNLFLEGLYDDYTH